MKARFVFEPDTIGAIHIEAETADEAMLVSKFMEEVAPLSLEIRFGECRMPVAQSRDFSAEFSAIAKLEEWLSMYIQGSMYSSANQQQGSFARDAER